ncbi:MAG: chondroitinase-B domain-containing protein [Paludibacter sp.]
MRISKKLILSLALILTVVNSNAATIKATSIADLQTKINSAASGDIINLASGHYTNNSISIAKSNITVQAATSGAVYLDGTDAITISGNNNTFSGFQFVSGTTAGANVVTVTGNYNTITQLNFNGYSASKMVQLSGLNNTVSYCNFQNKPTDITATKGGDGDMLQIIPNATNPGNNTIRYCSFQHMPGGGGDWGNECIRIGDGAYSTYISRTIVEYCYFEDTGHGDSEAISVKSRENILRYNTMNNNPDAMFAFRNGDNNVAYGNFFIKSGGIRCKQANNIYCYNNYFEGAGTNQTSGLTGGGTYPVYLEYFGVGYGDNFNFIHNTFYGCTDFGVEAGLTNVTLANNIFKQTTGTIFSGTNSGITYAGNIYQGTLGFTIPTGMTNADPKLTLNANGFYGISTGSAAIDAANASYPAIIDITGVADDATIMLDISGQLRPATTTLKDVGCSEFNMSGTVVNKPLALTNVGPTFLGGPSIPNLTNQAIVFNALAAKAVGDVDFAPGATATSGLTVTYASSNTAVATIVSNQIHIVGAGNTTITASQAGNSTYSAAVNVAQTLTVSIVKQNQTITFNALSKKSTTDTDFDAGATASSGLTPSYASSNTAVATIVNGLVHIVGSGMTTITASQSGSASYNAASDVSQSLSVSAVTSTSITLNPIADSYVYGGATTTNNGTLTELNLKKGSGTTGDRIIYLQFDISGQNIYSISSAKVRLYATAVPSTFTITSSQTTDSWTETGINYANCPVKGTDISSVSVTAAGAYYEWDVTAYIQSQFNANDNIISLVFSDLNATGVIDKFNSKEATSNTPQLYMALNKVVTSSPNINQDNFRMYTNAGSTLVNIDCYMEKDSQVSAQIYSLNGQQIKTIINNEKVVAGRYQKTVDISELKSGIYMIRFISNNNSKTIKLLISK